MARQVESNARHARRAPPRASVAHVHTAHQPTRATAAAQRRRRLAAQRSSCCSGSSSQTLMACAAESQAETAREERAWTGATTQALHACTDHAKPLVADWIRDRAASLVLAHARAMHFDSKCQVMAPRGCTALDQAQAVTAAARATVGCTTSFATQTTVGTTALNTSVSSTPQGCVTASTTTWMHRYGRSTRTPRTALAARRVQGREAGCGGGGVGGGPPRPEFAGSTADRPATSGSAWVPVSSTKKECTTRQVLVPMYTAPTA